jgi:hypothetical protein
MDLIGALRLVWKVLLVGLGLAGLVVGLGWVSSKRGGSDMSVMELESVEEVSIPAIDVASPTETETATFALG